MAAYDIGFSEIGIDVSKVPANGLTTCPSCSHNRKAHNQNKKVLKVYKDTGYYNCYHCDFKGRVDSNEWILGKEDYNPETQQEIKMPEIKPFNTGSLTEKAYQFLQGRGISRDTADKLKLAYRDNTICFNYYKDNEIVGAKYRSIAKKFFWQHAGCKKYLYNLDNIKSKDTIIIVEGEFDVLAIAEAGFLNVCSVSQGAPNEGQDIGAKLQCLDNSIEFIKDAKKVIICTDNDPNGRYLQKILIERFGSDRCATVELPEDCKDANDVLIQYGKVHLRECIENAKDTPISGVRTLDQARGRMRDIYRNGYKKGVSTCIPELEGHFSFYKGWWNLIHGIPNSGKSAFTHFAFMSMSVHHGWKWAVFSPEHYPEEDFYLDMVEVLTGKSTDVNDYDRLPENYFEAAMDFVNEHFFFVYPMVDDITNSVENVLAKIKELKLSKGIDGFLIDPYNQLVRGSNDNIDRYLEESLSKVDHLCKTHKLSGNIVAHPRTLYKEKDEPDYKKSTPYQIAGGAMWYNKSYCIINVHRPFNQSDKSDNSVEIDIQKVKSHKRAGIPDCVDMKYQRETGWYTSVGGGSALDGQFEKILQQRGIIQGTGKQKTFTEKLYESGGYTLDDCPF